jgi:hypothetical protein
MVLIFQGDSRENNSREQVLTGRPAPQPESKKPSDPGKAANEGIQRILRKTDPQAGFILLFAEKCSETFEADERNQTGILTRASDLFPPSRFWRNSGFGIRSPHSGATVPDSHRVPGHLIAVSGIASAVSKNGPALRRP